MSSVHFVAFIRANISITNNTINQLSRITITNHLHISSQQTNRLPSINLHNVIVPIVEFRSPRYYSYQFGSMREIIKLFKLTEQLLAEFSSVGWTL